MSGQVKHQRTETGVVVSTGRDKTIKVKLVRMKKHPIYGKYYKRTKAIHAHDENNTAKEGQTVVVREHRPFSKTKTWILDRILEEAK